MTLFAAAAFAIPAVAADSVTFKGICDGPTAVKAAEDVVLAGYDKLNVPFAFDANGRKSSRGENHPDVFFKARKTAK